MVKSRVEMIKEENALIRNRSDKAFRTKILKWLPPVFVNGYVNEATTINVSPVRI